jgi:DNA-binding PadR family transcriptional regulator
MRTARDQKTRFALLGMLTIQPMSGYDIRKNIEASVAHFWSESYGQIYPMLKGLAAEGLVTVKSAGHGPRNRRVYAITADGRAALQRWLDEPAGREVVRNELLLKLFFARNAPQQASLRHLAAYRETQQAELHRFRTMERELAHEHRNHPDLPHWLITLRFGIRQSEAGVRWADEALAQLKNGRLRKDRRTGAA